MGAHLLILFAFHVNLAIGQHSLQAADTSVPISNKTNYHHKLKTRDLIVPGTLITYGFWALNNQQLKEINLSVKRNLPPGKMYTTTTVDNYLQYSPTFAVYALNAAGIKGENNFRDRTFIYTLANIFTAATIIPLKNLCHVERPDKSARSSFPSGHTATAFAAAEFLRQEYKDVSVWYGVGGYLASTATGILRVYHNKHWASDIITGAGIGILSTKVAYWIYPAIRNVLFKGNKTEFSHLNAEDINKLVLTL